LLLLLEGHKAPWPLHADLGCLLLLLLLWLLVLAEAGCLQLLAWLRWQLRLLLLALQEAARADGWWQRQWATHFGAVWLRTCTSHYQVVELRSSGCTAL
jgi:hypothetical protein